MRVGIDIAKAVDPHDGVGRYAHGLLHGLMEVDPGGAYRLYGLHAPVSRERFEAAFPGAPAGFQLAPGRGPGADEVEVFHCTTFTVPQVDGLPLVFTLYDVTFLTHPRWHTPQNRFSCLEGTVRALLAGARLTTISRHSRGEVARTLGVPDEEVEVIPPATGPAFRPPADPASAAARRRALGVEGGYVLTVGTLEPRKNLPRLLAAHAALSAELRGAHPLVVVGGAGWHREALDRRLAAAPPGSVRLLGTVDEEALVALYGGATVVAYPSLAEGFGLPVLEAMACGAPVLTSSASSLPEVAGDAAVLVDPTEEGSIRQGLERLLVDAALRRRLASAGPERAARFSWRETARRALGVYRAAASRGGRTPAPSSGA